MHSTVPAAKNIPNSFHIYNEKRLGVTLLFFKGNFTLYQSQQTYHAQLFAGNILVAGADLLNLPLMVPKTIGTAVIISSLWPHLPILNKHSSKTVHQHKYGISLAQPMHPRFYCWYDFIQLKETWMIHLCNLPFSVLIFLFVFRGSWNWMSVISLLSGREKKWKLHSDVGNEVLPAHVTECLKRE